MAGSGSTDADQGGAPASEARQLAREHAALNFPVEDVDAAVEWLSGRGVEIEHYEGMGQESNGVLKSDDTDIAWFKDPAGNTLSVLKVK